VTLCGPARVIETARRFPQFGSHASGALVGAAGEREFGDINGKLVHVVDATTVKVAQAIVPEGAEGVPVEVVDKKDSVVGVIDATRRSGDAAIHGRGRNGVHCRRVLADKIGIVVAVRGS
jgi:hypothetical protein